MLRKVGAMMRESKDDLLASTGFPHAPWRQLWSTNPLERTNKEIKRCTSVVGVLPIPVPILRLTRSVLIEQYDQCAASERRQYSERFMALLTTTDTDQIEGQVAPPELMTAS
jgi:transposase-like protein